MKTLKFQDREEWLNARLGKILGSKVKDVLPDRNGGRKKGFWELVAERLINSAAINDDENAMDRGTRLEPEAMARFVKETGKKVDASLLIWLRDDDSSIGVSPDGVIGKTAAVEIKCLNAASHSEALSTGKIPKNTAGYEEQALQYFITNDQLRVLYYVFYDPRFPRGLDFFYLTIQRKDKKKEIAEYLELERGVLRDVREVVNKLSERIEAVQYVEVKPEDFADLKYEVNIDPADSNEAAIAAMYKNIKENARV